LSLQKWSCIGKWLVPHLPKGCKGIVWCRMRPAPLSLGDTKGSDSSSSFSSWSAWNKYCKEPKPTDFSSYIQRRHCGEVESAHLHMEVFKMCVSAPPLLSTTRWLHGLIETYGGVQPDTDEVHIPAGQKSDVKGWYDEELQCGNTDLTPVSGQHFNKVWAKSLPHLKCRAFLRWVCLCACILVLI